MAQTKEGIKKLRETMIKRHGSEEAWKAYMRKIGKEGGSNVPKESRPFYKDRELAKRAASMKKEAKDAV